MPMTKSALSHKLPLCMLLLLATLATTLEPTSTKRNTSEAFAKHAQQVWRRGFLQSVSEREFLEKFASKPPTTDTPRRLQKLKSLARKSQSYGIAHRYAQTSTQKIGALATSERSSEHSNQLSHHVSSHAPQRYKRQQHQTPSAIAASDASMAFGSLPAVPLPPPPPFPSKFALSPFGGSSGTSNKYALPHSFTHAAATANAANTLCGGVLTLRHGTIQTPNFPHKFPTPIECVWVIDASQLPIAAGTTAPNNNNNVPIIVYLTQLYVLGGLKFTEYMYYSDDYKVPAHRIFELTEDDVTQVAWVQFSSQYLEIRFTMATLDGTHLRALDRLLDVYGFNITYEVQQEVKSYQCNTLQCRFLGHCYAQADYSAYNCSCFSGFSGIDCGRGPLCEDPHTNICQNGGTCKHIGDAAITCHCPSGYKGTKCEIPEMSEITMGCTTNSTSSDCHRECDFEHLHQGVLSPHKTSKVAARNGKTRYEVTIRLGANLTAYYRNVEPERRPSDHLPTLLERHVSEMNENERAKFLGKHSLGEEDLMQISQKGLIQYLSI